MRTCPSCGKDFENDTDVCPDDGTPLAPFSKPESPPRPVDRLIGRVLDGKYRIEEKIGQGGMGAVYRAEHVHMHTSFAVKMLHRDSIGDEGTVERFRREALAAARIRHPNAVIVTDFGVSDVGAYLVMEYLEGSDLRRKLRERRWLPAGETVAIIGQVCAAIERAHRSGLIHRDIKPDNIWLVTDEETGAEIVKVLDFGIAKLRKATGALDALTEQGTMIGTPYYMSPEQCLGVELDPRSDVYSIGCVLYEMLTGQVPFPGDNPVAIGMKHNTEAPRPLRDLNPSIPEAIEAVVLKSLAKKAWNRQASARDLAGELAEALGVPGRTGAHVTADAGGATTDSMSQAGISTIVGSESAGTISGSPGGGQAMPTIVDAAATTGDAARTIVDATSGSDRAPGTIVDSRATIVDVKPIFADAKPTVVDARATIVDAKAPGVAGGASEPDAAIDLPAASTPPVRRGMIAGLATAGVLVVALAIAVPWLMRSGEAPGAAPSPEATAPSEPPAVDGMVFIPGGTYRIGSDQPDASPESQPSIEVTVRSFYIDTHEVTNAQYAVFVQERGVRAPPHWKNDSYPEGAGNLPVTNVTWFDAKAYARWAKKRLPTEEEWEAAARGFEGRRFPWGDDWSPAYANSELDRGSSPSAVGSYPLGASLRGVFDLASNVAEWVDDEFEPYPGSSAKRAPGNCIFRGGTYRSPQRDHLSWERFYAKPESRFDVLGFRCAKDMQ